jgi:hypothetical protein
MDKLKQAQQILDSMFPVGKERWVKVKYIDQEKSMETLNLFNSTPEQDAARGFSVQAISCLDEHEPQVAALFELKGNLMSILDGAVDEYYMNEVIAAIQYKMDEIKTMSTQKVENENEQR